MLRRCSRTDSHPVTFSRFQGRHGHQCTRGKHPDRTGVPRVLLRCYAFARRRSPTELIEQASVPFDLLVCCPAYAITPAFEHERLAR